MVKSPHVMVRTTSAHRANVWPVGYSVVQCAWIRSATGFAISRAATSVVIAADDDISSTRTVTTR